MRDGTGSTRRRPSIRRRGVRIALGLSQQQAELLRLLARCNADDGYIDVELHGSEPVDPGPSWALLHRFPPNTYRLSASWRLMAVRSFDDLADDLDAGLPPRPRTICEQFALALTIEDAAHGDVGPATGRDVRRLPARPQDEDWGAVRGFLCAGKASRLPSTRRSTDVWFVPFEPGLARNPMRGYRL